MSIWGFGFGKTRWAVALVLAGLAGLAGTSAARQPSREELEDRVRRLEQIIRDAGLDQPEARKAVKSSARPGGKPAVVASEPAPNKEEVEALVEEKLRKQKVLAGWKDGFFLESPNGDFKLKLRGYAQADARVFPLEEGDTGTDSIFLRRVRPIFEGTVYKYFDFRIMPDFGQGQTVLQDAYARVNYWPYAQLTAGKFKSPLSLERLQSGAELTFIERSISSGNIAPNREVGIALGGSLLDDRLSYMIGGFNGSFDGGSNDGDTTSDKDVQGRIFAEPFKGTDVKPLRGVGIGFAGTYGQSKAESIGGLQYKTAGRSNFFKFDTPTGTVVNFDGTRMRWAPQAYWYWGPFGLMGEYITSDADLDKVVTPKTGAPTHTNGSLKTDGWFVQASYVLTGEDASYRQVVPINNFDPANGRFGAFELAARASEVDINDEAFTEGFAKDGAATKNAIAYTGGLNWYLNKNFKLQLNYEHTDFDKEITFGKQARGSEDVFISRFQISY
jgi:phosphate-selective porin OprO/OprP